MQENDVKAKGSRQLRKGRFSWVGPRYFITSFIAGEAENIDSQLCFEVIIGELAKLENEGALFCEALVVMPDHIHMIVRLGGQYDPVGSKL